jgi:RHS repeat-associated protein
MKLALAEKNGLNCKKRKMTNELGAVVWSAKYYPFGEMTESGFYDNTHGFTGKEYDDEMNLNYFCQRYYDPQIGRFMTLDTWTQLPDDERLLSYERYLSWDTYKLKYASVPQANQDMSQYYWSTGARRFAYNELADAILSPYGNSELVINTFSRHIPRVAAKEFGLSGYPIYNHQLNRYVYCANNPLRYVDPTGTWGSLVWPIVKGILFAPFKKMAREWIEQQLERLIPEGTNRYDYRDFWAPDATYYDYGGG